MTQKSLALCAMLLIVSSTLFSGCANKKTRVAAFPGYFELAPKSQTVAEMDFGKGPEKKEITVDRYYYCYDQETQTDFLHAQKGK